MGCIFGKKIEDFNIDELRKSAESILEFTGTKAKSALDIAGEKFDELENNKKKMIIVGVSVFVGVLIIAGVFYLIGKHAGRREAGEFEFEEWDG